MSDQTISLSAYEVMVLLDRTKNDDRGTDDERVTPEIFMLKLGSAFVDQFGGQTIPLDLPITFTEAELWLMRSKIQSTDRIPPSDQIFGIRFLTKVYAALLRADSNFQWSMADVGDQEFGDAERSALQTLKERDNAGKSSDDNTD